MEMGKTGVWFAVHGLGRGDLVKLAQGVERLNYDVLWYPESVGYDTLSKETLEENLSWLAPGGYNLYTGNIVLCYQSYVIKTPHHNISNEDFK